MTATAVAPARHIEVGGHRIHLRFVQQAIVGIVGGLLATAAIAALYYLITQLGIFFPKASWDNLFSQSWWTTYRHGIRNVGEGILAKYVVETFLAKWQKHPDERLSGLQVSLRVPFLLIESLALIVAGIYVVSYGGPAVWHVLFGSRHISPVHVGYGASTLFAGIHWPDFIVGFVAAHILRPQWRPVGATISLAFIEPQVTRIRRQRLLLGDPGWLPWWVRHPVVPPVIRERIAWMLDNKIECRQHGSWMYRFAVAVAVAFIGLAAYGEDVLRVIAKGH